MSVRSTVEEKQGDLFRNRLDQIIDMRHEVVLLAKKINWVRIEERLHKYYSKEGRPGHPIRLMVGLHLLKHMYNLSDEAVCYRWRENPYYQYFSGETFFQHRFPIERSLMTQFRDRIGEEDMSFLIAESLRVAYDTGALSLKDVEQVIFDTTVQEKAITHPTDAKLMLKAIEKLGEAAKTEGIILRQSYVRVAKNAVIRAGRYRHAKHYRRAMKQEKFLRVRLGRLLRDVERKMAALKMVPPPFTKVFNKAHQVWLQQKIGKKKLLSWHAPEVECIGKGKAHKPYEFGCKVSLATNLRPAKGGHFVLHTRAMHGKPYDGHTLKEAIADVTKILGKEPKRFFVDRGYRGHNYPEKHKVFRSGQKRGVTAKIKNDIKRRSAIEPIIGHVKHDGRMARNYLLGTIGDKMNAIFAAVGFNLRQILNWFRKLLCLLFQLLFSCAYQNKPLLEGSA